jgi:hypothetical protein
MNSANRDRPKSSTTSTLGVPEILVIVVVLDGVMLLNNRDLRGGIIILAFGLVLLVFSRILATKVEHRLEQPRSYHAWLISKINEAAQLYGGKIGKLPASSYLSLVESDLYPQLKLELSEFMLIEVLAAGAGLDVMYLLESSLALDAPKLLKLDNRTYTPKNPFGRILLGLAVDAEFSGLPLRHWLIQGKEYLFEQQHAGKSDVAEQGAQKQATE